MTLDGYKITERFLVTERFLKKLVGGRSVHSVPEPRESLCELHFGES
jgi:hypothetical protein